MYLLLFVQLFRSYLRNMSLLRSLHTGCIYKKKHTKMKRFQIKRFCKMPNIFVYDVAAVGRGRTSAPTQQLWMVDAFVGGKQVQRNQK